MHPLFPEKSHNINKLSSCELTWFVSVTCCWFSVCVNENVFLRLSVSTLVATFKTTHAYNLYIFMSRKLSAYVWKTEREYETDSDSETARE